MSTMITPSLAVLLPAAINTFTPPRTEAEAKAYAVKMNAEAKRQREQGAAAHERHRQEAEASAALTKRLSATRPATRATAKASKLNPVDVYRTYNRVRASTLPEQRSSLCEARCYGGAEVCDGETACWSKRLEEKGAASAPRPAVRMLDVAEIYHQRNAPLGAGWRAAVDQVNGTHRPGPR